MNADKNVDGVIWDENRLTNLDDANDTIALQRAVLKTMVHLVEFRDSDTGGHIERTQGYLGALVGALIQNDIYTQEIDKWDIWTFLNSAQLHDVGKISIPDNILQKPGKLTAQEFEIVKEHATIGERIIEEICQDIAHPSFLEHAKVLAGSHHEKWDGSGYPRGLKGYDIPLQGLLMAIADVYDALISERPYKKATTHDQATAIILEGKGTHFDPVLVDVFFDISDDFDRIAAIYKSK